MMTLIAAALAAAQTAPATPAASTNPHAQHQQGAQQALMQHQQMAKMGEDCACCKKMMEKMHSEMKRMHDHREQGGH